MPPEIAWPRKTRELQNHHIDSTVWNDFPFRDDDVVIATYAKSGTTWTQQIVCQLIFDGDESVSATELSPWVDLRLPPAPLKIAALEAQKHRRFLKSHLPVDALVYSPEAKYIYIGRDGRDVLWSLHNHHVMATPAWFAAINQSPGRVGPPVPPANPDIVAYFREWLDGDGYPFWSMWENVASWWAIRDLPNLLMLHFNEMKADLPGSIRRIADHLGIEIDPARRDAIVEHCTFDYMKENAPKIMPLGSVFWDGGAKSFIHKGTNGRWRDLLTPDDVARYEATARERLGDDCARWLATGER